MNLSLFRGERDIFFCESKTLLSASSNHPLHAAHKKPKIWTTLPNILTITQTYSFLHDGEVNDMTCAFTCKMTCEMTCETHDIFTANIRYRTCKNKLHGKHMSNAHVMSLTSPSCLQPTPPTPSLMGRSDKRKREAEGLSAAEVLYNLGASSCTYGGARRGTVVTVLEFVSGRYNYHDEATWRKVIEGGQLRVNSAEAEPEQALRPGDVVSIESNRADEPEVDLQYKVLAVHPSTQKSPLDFIAVEKSGNLPVSASGRYRKNTLAYELQSTLDVRCKPVHRLDKETSGCVVVAKDDTTAATLSGIFAGMFFFFVLFIRMAQHGLFEGTLPNTLIRRGSGKENFCVFRNLSVPLDQISTVLLHCTLPLCVLEVCPV